MLIINHNVRKNILKGIGAIPRGCPQRLGNSLRLSAQVMLQKK
jgi:hypothetical protein